MKAVVIGVMIFAGLPWLCKGVGMLFEVYSRYMEWVFK